MRLVVPTKTKEVEKDDNNHETDDLHSAYEGKDSCFHITIVPINKLICSIIL